MQKILTLFIVVQYITISFGQEIDLKSINPNPHILTVDPDSSLFEIDIESYDKKNSVALELLGHNLFYSINYERKIFETGTIGIGASYANVEGGEEGSSQTETSHWVMLSLYYSIHSKKLSSWYFEPAITISTSRNPSLRIWFSPGVGYKFQMRNHKWWIKTSLMFHIPGLLIPVLPWAGLRIGYSF